jgi:hypothetical protein
MDVDKFKGKAQNLLKEHGDKIESGVAKAEKFAKRKTPKHGDKIDKVAGKIRGLIPDDKPGEKGPEKGPENGPEQTGPTPV